MTDKSTPKTFDVRERPGLSAVPFITGNAHELGTAADIPTGWNPQYVRFYRLSYNSTLGDDTGMFFDFLGNGTSDPGSSGIYSYNSTDIRGFIGSVLGGSLGDPQWAIDTTIVPGMRFHAPSHFVIQLDDSIMWNFLQGNTAIKTQKKYPSKYFTLAHYSTSTTGYVTAPGGCKLISFGAGMPDPVPSVGQIETDDLFNIYVGFDQNSGTVPVIIDPEIKNRGGDGPGNG